MSWILLPLIFLPLGITTPIDQYFQTGSPPSLDGSAQGANGGLNFQPVWNDLSQVTSNTDLDPSAGAINTPGLSNQEISSKQPYILADTSGRPTEFGTPPDNYVGRGPPTPLNSQIPLWDFGRYDGYPQRDSVGLRDPMTFMTTYYKQPQLTCATSGKTLYCCFPGEIMCEAYRERYPKCIPRQQSCCTSVDFYSNGLTCEEAIAPATDDKVNTNQQNWQINQNSNFRMPGEIGGSTGS